MGEIDIDAAWRQHSRQVLATLIRLLGNFDQAEEALHDAFLAATEHWPTAGLPRNPAAWLVSAGRFRAIDKARRRARFAAARFDIVQTLYPEPHAMPSEDLILADDQLRLIFMCCHPVLAPDAQVALTLRQVCGLTTEEIARAFLVRAPTVAQRIVRAKTRLKETNPPYEVPDRATMAGRLQTVLQVVYLLFNEGYVASSGPALTRELLSSEAIRLGRLLAELLPDAEVFGLLGMMLLHEARRAAREAAGESVLLPDQDRSLWSPSLIAEGKALVERAFGTGEVGPYAIQGAIAAVHCSAESDAATNWPEIVGLYDLLLEAMPSAIVRLNRAVAVFMSAGAERGLAEIEAVLRDGELDAYLPAQAALTEAYLRAGRAVEGRAALERALALCGNEAERRRLERKLGDLG